MRNAFHAPAAESRVTGQGVEQERLCAGGNVLVSVGSPVSLARNEMPAQFLTVECCIVLEERNIRDSVLLQKPVEFRLG